MALGGAFSALGGDATGALRKPPRDWVFIATMSFRFRPCTLSVSSSGDYYGNSSTSGKGNFTIGSFSLTGVQHLNQAGKWRNTAVSFGINRAYSFHDSYSLTAQDVNSSNR